MIYNEKYLDKSYEKYTFGGFLMFFFWRAFGDGVFLQTLQCKKSNLRLRELSKTTNDINMNNAIAGDPANETVYPAGYRI